MDEQRQDDQREPIYNSSVPKHRAAWTTYREWWTIETVGERGSGRSTLAARHDDDDDDVYLISVYPFGYETILHLTVRLQFQRYWECGVPLYCHYSMVFPDLSKGQIDLFKNYSFSIGPSSNITLKKHLKKFINVQRTQFLNLRA